MTSKNYQLCNKYVWRDIVLFLVYVVIGTFRIFLVSPAFLLYDYTKLSS